MRKYVDQYTGQLQKVAGLYGAKARRTYRQEVAEGPQAVREALAWCPERVRDLYITEDVLQRHREFNELTDGIWTHVVPEDIMWQISDDCQGIIAVLDQDRPDLSFPADLAIVAVEMTDPGNAGTLIRTADAAGADWVGFGSGSVEVTSPKVIRSAAGSTYHLPVATKVQVAQVVEQARASGMTILAADAHGTAIGAVNLNRPTLWLMGHEARGFAPEILEMADEVVSLPMRGRAESLNVSVAASICLYASVFAQESDV